MFKQSIYIMGEIIEKETIKMGNSSAVLLPKSWMNSKVKIELIRKPLNIKQDIFEILNPYLEDVLGIYLVGSYARGEEARESDVDILVITNKTNSKIEHGKYNIILVSLENMEKELKKNIFPLLPMLIEAKSILNSKIIKQNKDIKLTKENLKFHLDTTKSAIEISKKFIDLAESDKEKISDSVAYSLILRLRGVYIVECLRKKKLWSKKEFLNLIQRISGSLIAHKGYLRVKNNGNAKEELNREKARMLYDYIKKKIAEQEKWIKRRD